MGFDLADVESPEGHYGEFQCAICQQLPDLDGAVVTACAHVFCGTCIRKWLQRREQNTRCPSCNTKCPTDNYFGTLRNANPLAWRILAHLRVRCPLHVHGCAWKGEYSELQHHLSDANAHSGSSLAAGATAESASEARSSRGSNNYNFSGIMEEKEVDEDGVEIDEPDIEADASPPPSSSDISSSSGTSNRAVQTSAAIANAQSLKEQGTAKYEARRFAEALALYQRAYAVLEGAEVDQPTFCARLLCNAAACHLAIRNYKDAVRECRRAAALDPTFERSWTRLARALTHLGDFAGAVGALEKACELAPRDSQLAADLTAASDLARQHSIAAACNAQGRFSDARRLFSDIMAQEKGSSEAPVALLGLANAELGLGLTDRALRLTLRVLRADPQSIEAWRVRARANIMAAESGSAGLDLLKSGCDAFKEALRLEPDNETLKREWRAAKSVRSQLEQARQAHYVRDFDGAVALLSEAIGVAESGGLLGNTDARSPLRATLCAERATALVRLKRWDEALIDTSKALACRPHCREAILARASTLHALGRHEANRAELAALLGEESPFRQDTNIKHAHEQAEFEIRKAARPDYYTMLDIRRTAVDAEIRTGYRQQSLRWHPDKWSGPSFSDAQREVAVAKFKQLGEALEILTDPFKRQLYDEGYDKKAIEERNERAQRAARESENRGHHHH